MAFAEAIKRRILGFMDLLPCGRDLSLVIRRRRLGISYRGVYGSYAEATRSAGRRKTTQYDVVNQNKAASYDEEKASLGRVFRDYDYPLIFWLSQILRPGCRVLELGGSVGHLYHSIPGFFPYPDGLKWVISELPEAVELGRRIAADMGEASLSFVETGHLGECEPCGVFVTAGTLQYMQMSLPEVISSLGTLPEHVLVNSLPVHATREYWTLQDLGPCEVPYRVTSRSGLERQMASLGYREVRRWMQPRRIEIPFHLQLENEGYLGAYYVKAEPRD